MDQSKTKSPPYPPYFSPYPLAPNNLRGYKPSLPNKHSCSTACLPLLPSKPKFSLGYWELLSPALFGTAGALFLSLFSSEDNLVKQFGVALFKFSIVGYAIGATVAVSLAISKVIKESKAPYNHLLCPIGGGILAIIFLFAAEYLLLYRFFPSSFTGNVGDNLGIQFLSFLYLSITTIATADLGDILPTDITPRLLIATEIAFNLFTLATGIQLLLAQNS
ncbi:hypothetical protein [Desulfosporosinus nitroreducens]|uniref:hypothetical protein n=1 Tax=Desulfosporosinus nitroreducens TaxID=2018668 RepID=UPI00207D2F7C|nr:hypothetical protein [Desulfosporosinus nitroreducens]MCO1603234.1 hypothetical protein [Desulfosporosinus nitroreducens]